MPSYTVTAGQRCGEPVSGGEPMDTDQDRHYLVCMSQCINRALKYAEGGRSTFLGSLMAQDAVIWNLALIGKAAGQVSDEEKNTHPEVDWGCIKEFCADLLGNPWDYDRDRLWRCIEQELPVLQHDLRGILVASHLK